MMRAALAALALAGAFAAPVQAVAATIDLTTTADEMADPGAGCSLREAVSAARDNSAVGGCPAGEDGAEDVIRLAAGATYALTLAGSGEDLNAGGDLDLHTGPAGVALVASAPGARPSIDGSLADRILDVEGAGELRIDGLRLARGRAPGTGLTDTAGAIRWAGAGGGALTVRDALLEGNSAAIAGAIDSETAGGVLIEDSTIRGSETSDAGAVRAAGPATLRRSAIVDNIGGGLVGEKEGAGAVTIEESTVAGNRFSADLSVGGVYSAGGTSVENSTISGNLGGFVGGVHSLGHLQVSFSTIAGNGAPEDASGIRAGGLSAEAGAVLSGVVLADNFAGTLPSNCNEDQTFAEGASLNLESAGSCGLGAGSLSGVDPDLAPLADNGGPAPTRGLYPGSPALDRALACGLATDQRGVARGAACDLGAFEGTVERPPPPGPPAGGGTGSGAAQKPARKRKCKRRKGAKGKAKRGCAKRKRGKGRAAGLTHLAASGAAESRVIGRSVQGRAIVARRYGPADAERVGLVVGVIHGDERAGLGVARRMRGMAAELGDAQLWVIDALNPDGSRARDRKNARGVDLNRNFPFRWRGGVPRANGYYSGPRPGSEPEARAAMGFIREIEPDVSVWYHQPWGAVLACRGRPPLAARYARLAGVGTSCRGKGLGGTAISWQNEVLPSATAFVVELPAGGLGPGGALRHARAAATIIRDG